MGGSADGLKSILGSRNHPSLFIHLALMSYSPAADAQYCIYIRKSSEEEDRQVLSLEAQMKTLTDYALAKGISIARVFKDAASAHRPDNRPGFKSMMQAIAKGEVNAILVWDADRLARNMREGGILIDQLQRSVILAIETPNSLYLPCDNMLVLTIKFGMANQFSLDLSKVVKRGNRAKVEKGGWAGLAPIGYINNKVDKTIEPDPDRFKLVQNIFRLYLTGEYSIRSLVTMSRDWGLKTRNNVYLGVSRIDAILKNPFYYGYIKRGENEGMGAHLPMITKKEFLIVEQIMGGRHGSSPQCRHELPYRCFMQCGACGAGITAEEKVKYFCPMCKKGHTAKKPRACSCGYLFTEKEIKKANRYYYYHCTRKGKCKQPSIRLKALEKEFLDFVSKMEVNGDFIEWAVRWLDFFKDQRLAEDSLKKENKSKELERLKRKSKRLTELRMEAEIDKEEYLSLKKDIQDEIKGLEAEDIDQTEVSDGLKRAFELLVGIKESFGKYPGKEKDRLIRKIVSNPVLMDGKVHLKAKKHYLYLLDLKRCHKGGIEPPKSLSGTGLEADTERCCLSWSACHENFRTVN